MKRVIRKLLVVGLFAAVNVSTALAATVDLGTVSPPFSTIYGNSFASQIGQFVDDFSFTLSPAGSFETISASVNLGNFFDIEALQARLYQGVGPFNSGVTPLMQGWSTTISAVPGISGEFVVISPISLSANTYTLEVRGNVAGAAGGAYAGLLNIAALPIPEPETYALMLAGLALIGGIASRGRRRL